MTAEFYHELAKYIRRGTDQIDYCKNLVEEKIEKDKMDLLARREEGKVQDASAGIVWHHLEITLANTFRYTLFSGVCSVLEECIKAIAEKLIPDENERKKTLKQSENAVRAKKGWGNWLDYYIHLVSTVAVLNPTAQFQADVEQFTDVITLRNCIIHSWGNVARAEYPVQVRDAIQRIKVIAEIGNYNLAVISSDDYLVFGDNMVAHALCLAVPIVDYICRAMIAHETNAS